MGFVQIFFKTKTQTTAAEIVRETHCLLCYIRSSGSYDLKQEEKKAAMAKNIRALKSIVYDNDESYEIELEVQRDATQVVANLRRQKVQWRLIASEYLQKNTDVLDLLVAGCGNRHG